MKLRQTLALFTLFLMAITLSARENPFIPTKSYVEKKAEMVDDSYQYEMPLRSESEEIKKENMVKPIAPEISSMKNEMNDEPMLHNGKHNFLSFVILEVNDDTLSITTHNQLIKKFDLNYKNTRKIVFDFKSSKGFYSKKANLDSMNFKDIGIGAHPEKGYYRIAISVEDIPSNYDIEYEENTIHIMKTQM